MPCCRAEARHGVVRAQCAGPRLSLWSGNVWFSETFICSAERARYSTVCRRARRASTSFRTSRLLSMLLAGCRAHLRCGTQFCSYLGRVGYVCRRKPKRRCGSAWPTPLQSKQRSRLASLRSAGSAGKWKRSARSRPFGPNYSPIRVWPGLICSVYTAPGSVPVHCPARSVVNETSMRTVAGVSLALRLLHEVC